MRVTKVAGRELYSYENGEVQRCSPVAPDTNIKRTRSVVDTDCLDLPGDCAGGQGRTRNLRKLVP